MPYANHYLGPASNVFSVHSTRYVNPRYQFPPLLHPMNYVVVPTAPPPGLSVPRPKFLSTHLARGGGRIVGGTDASPGEFPHQVQHLPLYPHI